MKKGRNNPDNPSFNSEEAVTPFEKALFEKGYYHFDGKIELQDLIENIDSEVHFKLDWIVKDQDFPSVNPSLLELIKYLDDKREMFIWKQVWSGRIPKDWGESWAHVHNAFQETGQKKIQLSSELVYAGVTHPNHIVAFVVGLNQKLNLRQLEFITSRKILTTNNLNMIFKAQKKMGWSDTALELAKRLLVAEKRKN
jgi:hypothetical protein